MQMPAQQKQTENSYCIEREKTGKNQPFQFLHHSIPCRIIVVSMYHIRKIYSFGMSHSERVLVLPITFLGGVGGINGVGGVAGSYAEYL
jgi:hypothetical protein